MACRRGSHTCVVQTWSNGEESDAVESDALPRVPDSLRFGEGPALCPLFEHVIPALQLVTWMTLLVPNDAIPSIVLARLAGICTLMTPSH